jgi:hypothetical protein
MVGMGVSLNLSISLFLFFLFIMFQICVFVQKEATLGAEKLKITMI